MPSRQDSPDSAPTAPPSLPGASERRRVAGAEVVRATRWSALGRGGVQALRFGMQVVLTRLLADPGDPQHAAAVLGLVALALFFREFVDLFCDFGIGQAVIQRKELDERLLGTLFTLNLALGLLLALGVALGAPLVAAFFEEPQLIPLLRVLALGFAFTASSLVHRGLLKRRLAFDRLARIDVVEAAVVGGLAIAGVLAGLEAWGVVLAALAGTVVATAMAWRATGWRPRPCLDLEAARSVMGFVLNLTGSNVLGFSLANLDRAVVGRLGNVAMGHYDWVLRLVLYPVRTITTMLLGVLTATFSRLQDDLPRLREQYLRAVASIAVLTFPLMAGLAALAGPLIETGLGRDWLVIVPYLAFMAPVGAIQSLTLTGVSIYIARGRTDLMLRMGLLSGICLAAAYLIGARWGLGGVVRAYTAAIVVLAVPSFLVPFHLIGLSLGQFLARLWPVLRASLACFLAAWLTRLGMEPLHLAAPLVLAAGTVAGVLVNGAALWLFPVPGVDDLLRVLHLPPEHALRRRFAAAEEATR